MITTNGSIYIKRYMAGVTPVIARSIAFGIGGKAEAVGDTALQFEVARADIYLTSYDYVNNLLIFKATIPEQLIGTLYEAAIFSQPTSTLNASYTSKTISDFDSATEKWSNGAGTPSTYTTGGARIGADWLVLSPAASSTVKAVQAIGLNFSTNGGNDYFTLAYNVGSNVSNVKLRFMTDATNYYEYTITSPTGGYNFSKAPKNAFTASGTPSWANIASVEIGVTATSGGPASVNFDGLRVDSVQNDPEYVMVSRELLATPFIKEAAKTQEIEYGLNLTV